MTKILVSGSLAYDHIMDFPGLFKDHFLPEKLHNINVSFVSDDCEEHFGGTAGNVAYTLVLLGEMATIIATGGHDFKKYTARLEELGINTDSIHIDERKRTSFAYIIADMADNQIAAFHPGAGGVAYGRDVPAGKDDVAIISAGCADDMRALPDIYRGNGTKFLFDPGQMISALTADDLRNGMTDAEVVFCNDYEFAMIQNKTTWTEKDVLEAAKVLIITLGEKGSRVITKEGETLVPSVRAVELKDPTGAGDAYRAGYLKAMLMGKKPAECAQLGSAVATYAIEKVGTQEHTFSLLELKARYEATYGGTLAFT